MNKDRLVEVFVVFALAVIALVLNVNAYLIVFFMSIAAVYTLYRNDHELAKKNQMESSNLEHQIKSSSSDAHLKQKQLMTLVSYIPLPLILLNKEGKVVLYNTYFEVFRKSGEERNLTYKENDFERDVRQFVRDAYIFEREVNRTMNVNAVEYEAIGVPVTTKGIFSGCVVLFQDITKAKNREIMQKQFIADASHELKTPISAIKGMVEILNRASFHDDETRKDFLLQIQKENNRLEMIVMGLLQLSRLSVDNIVLRRELVDFTLIVDASINSFQQKAKQKDIQIIREYASQEEVFVDLEQMAVVVNNLLGNAIAYSDHGSIYVRTYETTGYYVFEVQDEGRGIALEDIEHIFERFYRVDKARSRASGGTGLGLSIVKSIIEAHDGVIEVESDLGKGSIFRVCMKY